MKLKTKLLQDVLGTLTNMIKYVNIKPITNLVEIYCKNNECYIGATDNITKIIGTVHNVEEPIDNFVVNLQDLYKLVKLTTKEEIDINKCAISVPNEAKVFFVNVFDERGLVTSSRIYKK